MIFAHPRSICHSALAYVAIAIATIVGGAGIRWMTSAWKQHASAPTKPQVLEGDGTLGPRGMMWIPGGEFTMGSDDRLAKANERPAHKVKVHGFWMDRTPVTNAEFAAFVAATAYVTTAERAPDWEALRTQLPSGTPKPSADILVAGAMVFVGTDRPVDLSDYTLWWRYVPSANWRNPEGPRSSIEGKRDFPVVQISYDDALAYARWAGKRLPTEAEWEFAARGGLQGATYAWGNEFAPRGQKMANVWDGSAQPFPVIDSATASEHGASPVCSFPANGYGLCDVTGNVWQWVSDWYRADAFAIAAHGSEPVDPPGPINSYDPDEPGAPEDAPKRVIRGGSFLCSHDYCLSYRPSARRGADPGTSMSHIGFRLARSGRSH
jgi:formylglycine-generating enzyme